MTGRRARFDHWPTGTKLLLLLSAALLPLGLAVAWAAQSMIADSRSAVARDRLEDSRQIAKSIESLIARNALALRVAANGVIGLRTDPCRAVASSLAGAPGIAASFALRDPTGQLVCAQGVTIANRESGPVAAGDYRLWIVDDPPAVNYRLGVEGGSATGELPMIQVSAAARSASDDIVFLALSDGLNNVALIDDRSSNAGNEVAVQRIKIGNGQLMVHIELSTLGVSIFDRLSIILPILMWILAAVLTWYVVRRLLILPLGRLQRAVMDYQPGPDRLVLPERLGSAEEIRSLGASFERAVDRIEESEQQMAEALAGQRRLVREVHHRVKNNLQVIASLLNIHGRGASSPESGAAYAAIGRRVDALSVVHRNHFAEVEESRGIALRPLLVELAATLRASSPDKSAQVSIQLDVDPLHTTQDAAVAVAFFVTEVVEFAMLQDSNAPVEIELRRVSELAAALTVSSTALVEEGPKGERASERDQFNRIVAGLARQLRSPLESKVGRLGVVLPVFPDIR